MKLSVNWPSSVDWEQPYFVFADAGDGGRGRDCGGASVLPQRPVPGRRAVPEMASPPSHTGRLCALSCDPANVELPPVPLPRNMTALLTSCVMIELCYRVDRQLARIVCVRYVAVVAVTIPHGR